MPIAQVNGFAMHYEDVGSGEPLVFYHGYLNSGNVWDSVVDHLKGSYRCITLDGRGAGHSERTADGHTIAQYADDMLSLASSLGIDRFTAVGFSMGGAVVTQAALKLPERIARLVLIGSPVDASHVDPALVGNMAGFSQLVAAGNRQAVDGFIMSITARREGVPFAKLAETALSCHEAHILGAIQSLGDLRPGAALNSLQTATLVIGASADPFLPATLAAARELPNSTLHVFSRVSHGMPWEVPAQVAGVIDDFMKNGVVTAASLAAG